MKQKWQTLGIVSRDQGLVSNIKGDETLSVLIIPYLSHFEGPATRQNKTKLAFIYIAASKKELWF